MRPLNRGVGLLNAAIVNPSASSTTVDKPVRHYWLTGSDISALFSRKIGEAGAVTAVNRCVTIPAADAGQRVTAAMNNAIAAVIQELVGRQLTSQERLSVTQTEFNTLLADITSRAVNELALIGNDVLVTLDGKIVKAPASMYCTYS